MKFLMTSDNNLGYIYVLLTWSISPDKGVSKTNVLVGEFLVFPGSAARGVWNCNARVSKLSFVAKETYLWVV